MHKPIRSRMTDCITTVIILITASLLLFSNLGNQCLWQDEAQTALIAQTILTHGIPLGYDGKNCFSQLNGAEYGKDYIWKYHPWLPFYVLAAFFGVFGANQYTARLPFVLFGIATVVLIYFFAMSIWKSRRAGIFAAVLLLLSVPFLILSRQCRYYSPAIFFSMLSLYAYLGILRGSKRASPVFVLSSLFLFQTQFLHYIALIAAVIVHSSIFERKYLILIILLSSITAVFTIPWLIWTSGLFSSCFDIKPIEHLGSSVIPFMRLIIKWMYPSSILYISLLFAAIWLVKNKMVLLEKKEYISVFSLLLLFIVLNILFISSTAPCHFFRYLAPLIPACCLLMAFIMEFAARRHIIIAIILLGIFAYNQPLSDYLYEITHDFRGPIDGIVKYLKLHGKKDDIVAMTYGDLPVEFHTGMRVVGGLTGEDLSPIKKADWIIIRRHGFINTGDVVVKYIIHNAKRSSYESIILDYPDTTFENREDPDLHLYRTADELPVVLLKRKDDKSGLRNSH